MVRKRGGNRDEEDKQFLQFEAAFIAGPEDATQQQREDAIDASVKDLIEKGLNVNARSKDQGWTPLHISITHHQFKAFKRLVDAGADMRAKTDHGYTLARMVDKEIDEYGAPTRYDDESVEEFNERQAAVRGLKKMRNAIKGIHALDQATGRKLPADVLRNIAEYGGRKTRAQRSRKTNRRKTLRRK